MVAIASAVASSAVLGDDAAKTSSAAAAAISPLLLSDRAATRAVDDTELRVPPRERPEIHDLSYAPVAGENIPLVWYHPLAGDRVMPENPSRRFGADRPGDRPAECGRGHCGVDLGEKRGPVVHAVRPGLVDRIMRTPDRLGGKYVRLYHPEGFFTYYMHLDVISPRLVPGVEVAAGEALGLLGSTGIQRSPPHLHFAVARVLEHGGQRYLDPEPMLRQAVVLEEPAPFPESWRQPPRRVAKASPPRPAPESKAEAEILDEGDAAGEIDGFDAAASADDRVPGLDLDEALGDDAPPGDAAP